VQNKKVTHQKSIVRYLQAVCALLCLASLHGQATDFTKALGTVYCDGGIRGTASHIALPKQYKNNQSIIVTAAHVLYDKHTDSLFKDCYYRPQNKRLSNITFAKISAHSYSAKAENKIAQAENDIVFIQLKHRAYQPALALSQSKIGRAGALSLLGVNPSKNPDFVSSDCQQLHFDAVLDQKLLLHNCPSKSGDSGAPILDNKSGEIIAVHGGRLNLKLHRQATNQGNWVKQGRLIDPATIKHFQDFLLEL